MSEVPVTFDIYIRMNEDDEKDYCFNVTPTTKFGDLFDIFIKLPLNLSPGIFYNRIPIAFKVSTAPGLLTPEGGMLFGDKAGTAKYFKPVSNDSLIKDNCWPGQLIFPVWEERTFFKYSVISVLLTWLYTDLPDFISPTPGICLTNHFVTAVWYILFHYFKKERMANNIYNDMFAPTGKIGQCLFFAFHVFKIGMIYLLFVTGMLNPYSLTRQQPPEISREDLVEMGWTGSKRAVMYEYSEKYRDFKIKKAGGILQAHSEGILDTLRKGTITLNDGEGFNTPFVKVSAEEFEAKLTNLEVSPENSKDLRELAKSDKYTLSLDLFTYQNNLFGEFTKDMTPEDYSSASRDFRKFGFLFFGSDFLRGLYTERLKSVPAKK